MTKDIFVSSFGLWALACGSSTSTGVTLGSDPLPVSGGSPSTTAQGGSTISVGNTTGSGGAPASAGNTSITGTTLDDSQENGLRRLERRA
ncbi:MAG: hypothetical protein QM756_06380 [Polyangiaceae bacterium]